MRRKINIQVGRRKTRDEVRLFFFWLDMDIGSWKPQKISDILFQTSARNEMGLK